MQATRLNDKVGQEACGYKIKLLNLDEYELHLGLICHTAIFREVGTASTFYEAVAEHNCSNCILILAF